MRGALVLVVLGALAALAFAGYMGAFRRVVIDEKECGPFTLVYRTAPGSDMGAVREITDELDEVLARNGIEERTPLDVFHPDDRAEVGFAVSGASEEQLSILGDEAGVRQIPARECMVTRFPWRNPLSFVIGYFKVDPALKRHRAAHGYEKAEALALNEGSTILYMQPIVSRNGGD